MRTTISVVPSTPSMFGTLRGSSATSSPTVLSAAGLCRRTSSPAADCPFTVFDSTAGATNYSYNGSVPATGTGPYLPAQVIGAGQGNLQPVPHRLPELRGFASAGTVTGFPNQPRNSYRGPGFFDSDFSINKNFKANRARSLRCRCELLQRVQPPELRPAGEPLWNYNLRPSHGTDGSADRSVWIVLRGFACRPHHSSCRARSSSRWIQSAWLRRPFGAAFFGFPYSLQLARPTSELTGSRRE
jgi:hypothetical protein